MGRLWDLPALQDLSNVRALANFSFGQGELTATPLQLCAMMNAIANGGTYASPKLVLGLVDEERQLTETPSSADREGRVMKASTAQALREALLSAAREGTGSPGAPENGTAGIKTGTAKPAFMKRGGAAPLLVLRFCLRQQRPPLVRGSAQESSQADGGVTARVFQQVAQGLISLEAGETGETSGLSA